MVSRFKVPLQDGDVCAAGVVQGSPWSVQNIDLKAIPFRIHRRIAPRIERSLRGKDTSDSQNRKLGSP